MNKYASTAAITCSTPEQLNIINEVLKEKKQMDMQTQILDLMRQGLTQEQINNAAAIVAKERAEAKAKDSSLQEARAHIINAILAYNEVYHFTDELTEEDMKELEQTIIDTENQMVEIIKLGKSLDKAGFNLKSTLRFL